MTDREQFEAWASDNGAWPKAIERDGEGYKFMGTQQKWGAWKAARNIQEMQPQAEAVPSNVVRDADVEAAAKKMAEIFDYPWDFMPEKGRNTMRENVRAVLDAAIAQQKTK